MLSYVLSIENNQTNRNLPESDLKTYIEWSKNYSKTTMSPKKKEKKTVLDLYKIQKYIKVNRPWYTYGHYILRHKKVDGITRQIGGKIALIEKFGVKTRPNIAYFSTENLTGSNSFFFGEIIAPKINSMVLGSWFCSSLYLLLYLYNRREIGGDYGRIKIKDFQSFKCIDTRKLSKDQKKEIVNAFKEYRTNFPENIDIYSQILNRNKHLATLDKAILSNLNISLDDLNIEQFLENLYKSILEELEKSEK